METERASPAGTVKNGPFSVLSVVQSSWRAAAAVRAAGRHRRPRRL